MEPDVAIRAYVAGIIDGEGCITITTHHTGMTILVAVTMTDRRAIDVIRESYGGKFIRIQRKNPKHKPVYMWRVEARKAERILRDLRPFLRVKAEQADLALSVRDHMRNGGVLSRGPTYRPGCEKDVQILAFRATAKARMHELNKRGVN